MTTKTWSGVFRILFILLVLLLQAVVVSADIYVIKADGTGDFPTVQAGVDAASDGDILELENGVFFGEGNRDIDYLGKAITIRSQSGVPEESVIDCGGTEANPHRGFYFHSGEDPDAILEGLTIRNGYIAGDDSPQSWGGGILCVQGSSPTVSNVVFHSNTAFTGGGMGCDFSSPTLGDCLFRGNEARNVGGGLVFRESSPLVGNCRFEENVAATGGGACLSEFSTLILEGCTFSGNTTSGVGGAVWSFFDEGMMILSCTLVGNSAPYGAGIGLDYTLATFETSIIAFNLGEAVSCPPGGASVLCCDVYGNIGGDWVGCLSGLLGINGNISEDPLFCDPENGDFTIRSDSPCAPFSPPNEECDLIGAWPVGCQPPTAAQQTTWGQVKALFQR